MLLYVDDEETIGRAVARWFERRGHIVHQARSLSDARNLLGSNDPDAIFIDVWLGTESGFELLAWIEDTRPHLAERVVFVTGELADSDVEQGRIWRTLGRPVVRKPFDFKQLEAYAVVAEDAEQGTGT
ncbi:MAG TPA: response regulator [Gemmatimonadaceae bacterium]|nr:response regulator [Gemmatimonadaceae bacterium]